MLSNVSKPASPLQTAPPERPGATGGQSLDNNAKSDFTIIFGLQQERRNSRYDLRNRAREIARQVPAVSAQKKLEARQEKSALRYEQARQARAQRKGQLFAPAPVPRQKIELFKSHRLAYCGASVLDRTQAVLFREGVAETRAGVTGLQSCGSYACPVCAPKIGQRRYEEVTAVLQTAKNRGLAVAMVTMTVRHSKNHLLQDLWDGISDGWREITTSTAYTGESVDYYEQARQNFFKRGQAYEDLMKLIEDSSAHLPHKGKGAKTARTQLAQEIRKNYPEVRAPRGWKQSHDFRSRRQGLKETYGIKGIIRATEVTVGKNGFHPHIHALVIFDPGCDGEETAYRAEKIGAFMHKKFKKGLGKVGLESWRDFGGFHVSVMDSTAEDVARYATKASRLSGLEIDPKTRKLGLESTRGDLKTGRKDPEGEKSLTPLELLEVAVSGDEKARKQWQAFATVSQGRRWLVIPAELRELAGLNTEKSDEEVAAETYEGFEVASVSRESWRETKLWLHTSELLTILETAGAEQFFQRLRDLRVNYLDVRKIE